MSIAVEHPRPKRSLIPWIFVGAMAVVIAVNAVMVSFALSSWTGLVVEKPYERGVAYNRILEAQHRQDALGWRFDAQTAMDGEGRARIRLAATAPDGSPLDGLALTGVLVRPIETLPDLPLAFRPDGPGLYAAETALPRAGQWELRVDVRRGGDRFHLIQRLVLK